MHPIAARYESNCDWELGLQHRAKSMEENKRRRLSRMMRLLWERRKAGASPLRRR
jgi:hypothetical protein